ncbi:hypothetical protein BDR06DRAFT_623302 [Suillus hirtellus]|nr:hypothetical protein BDR06DRAFT_623302 [Suillus hirtellus]
MAFLQQVDSNCVEICLLTHYCPVSTYALHICATSVTRLLRAYTCLCVFSLDSFSLVHVHFSVYSNLFASVSTHFFGRTCCYLLQIICTCPTHFHFFLSVVSLPALVVCTCHHALLLI